MIVSIEDIADVRLASYRNLKAGKASEGIFIAETLQVIENAVSAGCMPQSFLVERKHIEGKARDLLQRFPDIPVYTADNCVLESLTGYPLTRGILSCMYRPMKQSAEEVCKNAKRVAVLQGVTDAVNIGTIFRSAAALGADALLLGSGCCDPYHRRAVRVSMGSVFRMPWAYLQDDLTQLSELGFTTAALALDETALRLDDHALAKAERLALVFGNEGDGLSAEDIAVCDHTVYIPMSHGVDSLNVAAASAVVFWELCRNR